MASARKAGAPDCYVHYHSLRAVFFVLFPRGIQVIGFYSGNACDIGGFVLLCSSLFLSRKHHSALVQAGGENNAGT